MPTALRWTPPVMDRMPAFFLIRLMAFLVLSTLSGDALAADDLDKTLVGSFHRLFQQYARDERVLDAATQLFWSLAAISLVWTMGMQVMRQDIGEMLMELTRFVIVTSLFYWLLVNASDLRGSKGFVGDIVDSFFELFSGSPNASSFISRGNDIGGIGIQVYLDMLQGTESAETGEMIVANLLGIGTMVVLSLVTAQFLLLLIAAWMMGYAGIILLGFGGARWTSPIAINFYKHVLAIGLCMFALGIIGHQGAQLLGELASAAMQTRSGVVSYPRMGLILPVSILLLVLALRVPQMLYAMVTGSNLGLYAGTAGVVGSAIGAGGTAAMASVGSLAAHMAQARHRSDSESRASVRADSVMDAVQRSAVGMSSVPEPFQTQAAIPSGASWTRQASTHAAYAPGGAPRWRPLGASPIADLTAQRDRPVGRIRPDLSLSGATTTATPGGVGNGESPAWPHDTTQTAYAMKGGDVDAEHSHASSAEPLASGRRPDGRTRVSAAARDHAHEVVAARDGSVSADVASPNDVMVASGHEPEARSAIDAAFAAEARRHLDDMSVRATTTPRGTPVPRQPVSERLRPGTSSPMDMPSSGSLDQPSVALDATSPSAVVPGMAPVGQGVPPDVGTRSMPSLPQVSTRPEPLDGVATKAPTHAVDTTDLRTGPKDVPAYDHAASSQRPAIGRTVVADVTQGISIPTGTALPGGAGLDPVTTQPVTGDVAMRDGATSSATDESRSIPSVTQAARDDASLLRSSGPAMLSLIVGPGMTTTLPADDAGTAIAHVSARPSDRLVHLPRTPASISHDLSSVAYGEVDASSAVHVPKARAPFGPATSVETALLQAGHPSTRPHSIDAEITVMPRTPGHRVLGDAPMATRRPADIAMQRGIEPPSETSPPRRGSDVHIGQATAVSLASFASPGTTKHVQVAVQPMTSPVAMPDQGPSVHPLDAPMPAVAAAPRTSAVATARAHRGNEADPAVPASGYATTLRPGTTDVSHPLHDAMPARRADHDDIAVATPHSATEGEPLPLTPPSGETPGAGLAP